LKLTFLGTRAALTAPGNGHLMHSALLIEHVGKRMLIDCGSDWRGLPGRLRPEALLLTHAHDDHAGGLDDAFPCPVWASDATWEFLADLDLPLRHRFAFREPFAVAGVQVTPWPVVHSFRAPAVAFRITDGTRALFYAPDVVALPDAAQALAGVDLYVGDGTAFDSSLRRVEEDQLCGHAPLPEQLAWCAAAGVRRMRVTHCGETLCGAKAEQVLGELSRSGRERGVEVSVVSDGEELEL